MLYYKHSTEQGRKTDDNLTYSRQFGAVFSSIMAV